MKLLFLFLDGVGLGRDDPQINPFARVEMPFLQSLLGGRRLLAQSAPAETQHASLIALDAGLGVGGLPQSASGQSTLLTGQNVPAMLGYHYGPKPNPPIAEFLQNGNLFSLIQKAGGRAALLNAYPQGYFDAIHSGKRLYSAIPLAVTGAGIPLKTAEDLYAGRALAADFTGRGWVEHLGLHETPQLSPRAADQRLASLAGELDLAFFEYWLSDYAGHRQDMQAAENILKVLDQVFRGLLETWDDRAGLILLTSDHGNLEDLSTRRHTLNPVPCLLVGSPDLRQAFHSELSDLTHVMPAILQFITGNP